LTAQTTIAVYSNPKSSVNFLLPPLNKGRVGVGLKIYNSCKDCYSDFADPGDSHYPELLNPVMMTVIAAFTGKYLTRLLSPLVLRDDLLFY